MLSKYLDPKNDVAFKKIFGSEKHKDILIHFINDILGFKDDQIIKEVRFLSPVQDPLIAFTKQSIVDVLCTNEHGVQYIIEMQVAQTRGFEKRAQYYAAKAYCTQLDKGKGPTGQYSNLKEVIFITIADCVLFPEKPEYKSDHVVLDKCSGAHDLKDFYFTFIELPKFTKGPGDKLENIVEKWCYFFKYAHGSEDEDFSGIIEDDLIIGKAYEALAQHSWTKEELRAYEAETKRVMDNLAVEAFKIDAAEARGEARGKAEGLAEGQERAKLEMVKNMLAQGLEIRLISKLSGLTLFEIEKLK